MRRVAIVVLMLGVAVPVFGEQSTPDAQANMRFGALRSAKPKSPYGPLFAMQQPLKSAVAHADASPQPKVVCGMLIIPADPSIDPKMRVTPPQDPNLEYKIRVMEPPVCGSASK